MYVTIVVEKSENNKYKILGTFFGGHPVQF